MATESVSCVNADEKLTAFLELQTAIHEFAASLMSRIAGMKSHAAVEARLTTRRSLTRGWDSVRVLLALSPLGVSPKSST